MSTISFYRFAKSSGDNKKFLELDAHHTLMRILELTSIFVKSCVAETRHLRMGLSTSCQRDWFKVTSGASPLHNGIRTCLHEYGIRIDFAGPHWVLVDFNGFADASQMNIFRWWKLKSPTILIAKECIARIRRMQQRRDNYLQCVSLGNSNR